MSSRVKKAIGSPLFLDVNGLMLVMMPPSVTSARSAFSGSSDTRIAFAFCKARHKRLQGMVGNVEAEQVALEAEQLRGRVIGNVGDGNGFHRRPRIRIVAEHIRQRRLPVLLVLLRPRAPPDSTAPALRSGRGGWYGRAGSRTRRPVSALPSCPATRRPFRCPSRAGRNRQRLANGPPSSRTRKITSTAARPTFLMAARPKRIEELQIAGVRCRGCLRLLLFSVRVTSVFLTPDT